MVNEILNSRCTVLKNRYQSVGDVASYFINVPKGLKKIVKVKKFNADCIKATFNIVHKIVDSFFYLKKGGKTQLQDKWILVETKGDKIRIGIEQLTESLNLFSDAGSSIYGRIVLKNVPAILSSSDTNLLDALQRRFVSCGGNLRRGNKILVDNILLNKSKFIIG